MKLKCKFVSLADCFDVSGNQFDFPHVSIFWDGELIARIFQDFSKDICRGVFQNLDIERRHKDFFRKLLDSEKSCVAFLEV